MKLIYNELINEMKQRELNIGQIIKQHGGYTKVSTDELCFRDFAKLLGPGTSLDKFMSSQGYTGSKLCFPFEWMTSLEKVHTK